MSRKLRLLVAFVTVTFFATRGARAQPEPEADALSRAKQLFQEGNELRKAGDCERALERFAASRALVPSVPNILNTAYCLGALGRIDEALDAYAVLATDFEADLTAEELAQILSATRALEGRVGGLDVVANVPGATLVVDARPRGVLPRMTPVRLLPGAHRVVVLRDGYQAATATVTIEAGRVTALNVALDPVAIAGRVRVDGTDAAGASVVVDGTPIAVAPWEGTLAAGTHWIALVRGDVGTAPTRVVVVDGQTVRFAAPLLALGPALDVRARPSTARLSIDDIDVGAGGFRGRLPLGPHVVVAREEGYRDERRAIDVAPGMTTDLHLELVVDPAHPRWIQPGEPLRFFVEARGGVALGPGLGSGAESSCDEGFACGASSPAVGGIAELRAALLFPIGVSLDLAGGWLGATVPVTRTRDIATAELDVRYAYDDAASVSGPFVAVDAGYRFVVGALEPRVGVGFGVLFASASDDIVASATSRGVRAKAWVEGAGESTASVDLFVRPELGLGVRVSDLRFGLDVGVPIFLLEGPENDHGNTIVSEPDRCDRTNVDVFCAPFQQTVANERAYGRFVLVTTTVSAGFVF